MRVSTFLCRLFVGLTLVLLEVVFVAQACTCRSLRFDKQLRGKRLLHHVIDRKQASSEQWCRFLCLWNDNCVSINFDHTADSNNMHSCELNNANEQQFPQDLKNNKDFTHHAAENPCISGPCGKNELCQAGFDCEKARYRCVCKSGYSGHLCDESQFILPDSVIIDGDVSINDKLNEYLRGSMQKNGSVWKRCFRASDNQYSASAFHASCDNKGPTVTLVRVGGNHVFGGYAGSSWDKNIGWSYSNTSFLFTLKNDVDEQHKMPVYQREEKALYNSNNYGPSFGEDLAVTDRCDINRHSLSNVGVSYKPPNGYSHGSKNTRELLAGSQYFLCSEYEVFYQE